MHKLRLAYLALTATALGPLGAHAETARTALPPAVAGVIACMPVAEPAARLACLDKAAAALQAAAGGGDLVILDRQQVRKSQRENLGRASPAELPGVPPGANSETFDVIAATQGVDSHWVLILKDGGRWRLIEEPQLSHLPGPGSKARISKGALGSYFIEIDGHPGVRANRIG
jgi:hypothetical protein